MARISSGSRCAANGVEPVISANITVTTRLSSGGGRNSGSGCVTALSSGDRMTGLETASVLLSCKLVPHSMQNFAIGRLIVPQFGQTTRRFPHSRQNFAFAGFTVWQLGQRITILSLLFSVSLLEGDLYPPFYNRTVAKGTV